MGAEKWILIFAALIFLAALRSEDFGMNEHISRKGLENV
jgi:hypothetical protein